jgi:precorrin-6B methylase 2
MSDRITNKILKFSRKVFFEDISPKFRKDLLKGIMDFSYILFEKIAIKFNIISLSYLNLYSDIVDKEIKMAEINLNDKILVIGCGAIPSTSILISKKTNAKIIAIDKDFNAIDKAKTFLSNIDYNEIELEYANGLNYDVNKFNVIFILYGVKNLNEVLIYLYKKIKNDTKIIVRLNEEKNKNIFYKFHILKKVKSKYLGQVYSYLLKK